MRIERMRGVGEIIKYRRFRHLPDDRSLVQDHIPPPDKLYGYRQKERQEELPVLFKGAAAKLEQYEQEGEEAMMEALIIDYRVEEYKKRKQVAPAVIDQEVAYYKREHDKVWPSRDPGDRFRVYGVEREDKCAEERSLYIEEEHQEEKCEHGIERVQYYIGEMVKEGVVSCRKVIQRSKESGRVVPKAPWPGKRRVA